MPVYLPREKAAGPAGRPASGGAGGDIAGGLRGILISTLPVVVVAAVILLVGMRSLRPALLAADKLLHVGSEHWSDALMPMVLLGIIGLVFGAALGWRISASASLGGGITWLVACVSILVAVAVGVVAAPTIFTAHVPNTCWIGLTGMAVAALVGTYFSMAWLG